MSAPAVAGALDADPEKVVTVLDTLASETSLLERLEDGYHRL